jgi:hypothetical protein
VAAQSAASRGSSLFGSSDSQAIWWDGARRFHEHSAGPTRDRIKVKGTVNSHRSTTEAGNSLAPVTAIDNNQVRPTGVLEQGTTPAGVVPEAATASGIARSARAPVPAIRVPSVERPVE